MNEAMACFRGWVAEAGLAWPARLLGGVPGKSWLWPGAPLSSPREPFSCFSHLLQEAALLFSLLFSFFPGCPCLGGFSGARSLPMEGCGLCCSPWGLFVKQHKLSRSTSAKEPGERQNLRQQRELQCAHHPPTHRMVSQHSPQALSHLWALRAHLRGGARLVLEVPRGGSGWQPSRPCCRERLWPVGGQPLQLASGAACSS